MRRNTNISANTGLTAKMVGMSLLLGVMIWSIAQWYETQGLQEAFEVHLKTVLVTQAQEDRINFANYGKRFQQTARLIAGQQSFHSYFTDPDRRTAQQGARKWRTPPDWFLDTSTQRVLSAPNYILLFDARRQLLESFCRGEMQLPDEILAPSALLLLKSFDQTHIRMIANTPYMLSAARTVVAGEELTLLLAQPIDEDLLNSLNVEHDRLMALVSHNEQRILVSSNRQLLPTGALIEDLEKDYVISGRSFYDNGGAEMMTRLSSFLPRSELAQMKSAFVEISWWQRTLSALVLLLGPIPMIFWVSRRVRRLTGRVRQFCRETLRVDQAANPGGDELRELDGSIQLLMAEVLDSHQVIREETRREDELKSQVQQKEQQLQLLLSITEMLNVGVLSCGDELRAENPLMERWAKAFGGLDSFSCKQGHCGRLTLSGQQGEEAVFDLQCLCLADQRTVVLVRDLTAQLKLEAEREKLQNELLQAQKMESVGRLAGGIAHDFNNILMSISGNLQLMQRRVKSDEPIQKYMRLIDESARRAADLTRQLLGFSRKQIIAPSPQNLNLVTTQLSELLKRLIGENVEVKIVAQEGLWPVVIDRTQVEQVVMNLAVNARDAMSGSGTLLIETANVTLSEEHAHEHLDGQTGDYVRLSVSDTGCGIAEAEQERIFEPFYTTKQQGEGTGLGLSMVYGIIKQNGGKIYVYSEEGEGTTFKIYLPRSLKEVSTKPVVAVDDSLPRGSETVLLVEDDLGVRSFAVELLSELGYTVIEAADGEEALHSFEKYHGKIHLLLTDVILPKMNGRQLAEQLQEISADLVVIYMSGYTQNAIVNHGVLQEGIHFLAKPLASGRLAQAVRKALDPQIV